jgi:hypothetical protein
MSDIPTGRIPQVPAPDRFDIRVTGHLAQRWVNWFDGMTLTQHDDGTTVIHGPVADQSALHGLLGKLSDLGLPLVSVKPTEREQAMTTISKPAPTTTAAEQRAPWRGLDPMRKVALAGGVLYLITFAASIPQLKLFAKIIDDPEGYVMGRGGNAAVLWGSWLEVITAVAGIGTAVALYPVTRRVSKAAAIGFVTSRVVEAALILVGVVSLLAVVTLRTDLAGATGARAEALRVTGHALVELRQWTFLVGPGLIAGVNALFLGNVMYRSRLVPRIIPTVGLIGAPLILASATGTMFGLWDQVSGTGAALALPIAAWEFSLGVWLTVKGFKPAGLSALDAPAAATHRALPVA